MQLEFRSKIACMQPEMLILCTRLTLKMQEHVILCNDLWVAHATVLGLDFCLPLLFSSNDIPK